MRRSTKHWRPDPAVFSLGGSEILIVVLIALLLFGPDKIPQLARTIGRFTKEFNKYKDIMESTIRMEVSRAEEPEKDGLTVEQRITKAGSASASLIEKSRTDAADEPDAEDEDGDGTTDSVPESSRVVARPSADESDEEDQG
jgi:TatA/E family protein of Tat protein translocase